MAELEETVGSTRKINKIIVDELREVVKKYGQPRKSLFIYPDELEEPEEEDDTPDYPVNLFITREGYFKKITPQSLRMSGAQKMKEGDEILLHLETTNKAELLLFTDRCQVYKGKAADFSDTKASVLGDYLPTKYGFDEGEKFVSAAVTLDYAGELLFIFENGKAARVPVSAYQTKTNRKSSKTPIPTARPSSPSSSRARERKWCSLPAAGGLF